jgi:thermitase
MPRFPLRLLPLILCLSLILPPSPGRAAPTADSSEEFVPGELIVGMKPGTSLNSLSIPAEAVVKRTSPQLNRLNAALISVPPGQEQKFAERLRRTAGVRFAEPNYLVLPALIPNDSRWGDQYGPAHIQAPQAWDVTTGSSGVIVAVIDSGIDANHPEFSGRLLPGYDFIERDNTPQDGCGHGTHVAGIIAAEGNNATGIAGLAWQTRILPVRVLGNYCAGSVLGVAEGIVWAVERGARILNLSVGTSAPSSLLENSTYYAYTHGAAILAAAGNAGASSIVYPARYPWVMAVGATDAADQRVAFSNSGAELDLMAPGKDILSTTPWGAFFYEGSVTRQYGTLSGTSMATAHASGAAALLASLPQFDSPDKIYQALTNTALDLETPGWDNQTGYGLIQIYAALNFTPNIIPTPTPAPSATSYDILKSTTCSNLVQYQWRDATLGSQIPLFGNDGYTTIPLPFSFTFGGLSYTQVTVSANGYLTFGGVGSVADNFFIPAIAEPNQYIAPFWDDLNPQAGSLYQRTLGSAPDRQFVIEWHQVPSVASPTSRLTFEVVLFEGSHDILFQYRAMQGADADGRSATIGVEYANGTEGREYAYNQAGAIRNGLALLFKPYPTGGTPPSLACRTYTRLIDLNGGFFDAPPFCLEIPSGALQHPATLEIRPLSSAPAMPEDWLDLSHYADISLYFSPPPPLSPWPEAYVCYRYTQADLLQAGGYPQNLFLAIYEPAQQRWESLPTFAQPTQGLILARAPHFSIYGVATYPRPSRLPVTGAPLAPNLLPFLSMAVFAAALFLAWRLRGPKRR